MTAYLGALGTAAAIGAFANFALDRLWPSAPSLPFYLVFPLLVSLFLLWRLLQDATQMRVERDLKIGLVRLDVRCGDNENGFRVSVRNLSQLGLEGIEARLIDVSDEAGALRLGLGWRDLDIPVHLYTSERLKERNSGGDWYARPFNLAAGESKLIEVFRRSRGIPTPIVIVDGKEQHDLATPDDMTFRCEIVGAGKPLAFSLRYRSTAPEAFSVELLDANGQSMDKKDFSPLGSASDTVAAGCLRPAA